MRNKVTVTEIKKAVKSVQAQHRVVHQMLVELHEALDLLDPRASITLRAGKAMPIDLDGPRWVGRSSCKTRGPEEK